MTSRSSRAALWAACLLFGTASAAPARSVPAPVSRRCVIANIDVWTVTAAFKKLSPEERVNRLNDRLAHVYGNENLSARNVHVVRRREFADLYVGRTHVFTVTPEDAAASSEAGDTVSLARKWAERLKKALPQAVKGANVGMPLRRPRLRSYERLVS